jgi:hypothetical protein
MNMATGRFALLAAPAGVCTCHSQNPGRTTQSAGAPKSLQLCSRTRKNRQCFFLERGLPTAQACRWPPKLRGGLSSGTTPATCVAISFRHHVVPNSKCGCARSILTGLILARKGWPTISRKRWDRLLFPAEFRREVLHDLVQPRNDINDGYKHLARLMQRGLCRTVQAATSPVLPP